MDPLTPCLPSSVLFQTSLVSVSASKVPWFNGITIERYILRRWAEISGVGRRGQPNTNVVSISSKDTKWRGAQVNLPNLASIRNRAHRNIQTIRRIYGTMVMRMITLRSGGGNTFTG